MIVAIELLLGLATLAAAVSALGPRTERPPTARQAERQLGTPVRQLATDRQAGESADRHRIS